MGENIHPKNCQEMLVAFDDGKSCCQIQLGYNVNDKLHITFFDKIQDDRARQCIQLKKMINKQYYNMYKDHLTFQEITNSFNSRACPNYFKINTNSLLAEHLLNSDLCNNNIINGFPPLPPPPTTHNPSLPVDINKPNKKS
jgi:hypothetical protein